MSIPEIMILFLLYNCFKDGFGNEADVPFFLFVVDKEAQVGSALFLISSFLRSSLSVIFLTSPEAVDE